MYMKVNRILSMLFGLALIINFAACGAVKHVQTVDCSVVAQPEAYEVIQINEAIMFDYDVSLIRADQMDLLDRIAAVMTDNPDMVLVLEGHASEEGDVEYNLNLSQMRANSVKNALMLRNISEDNIKDAIGNGETTIFGDLLDDNRRVMVLSID